MPSNKLARRPTVFHWLARPGVIVVALATLAACSSESTQDAGTHHDAVPVSVATVEQRDVPIEVRAIGNVEAYATVIIKSQVVGQLAQVHFEEGQRVRKNDRLFSIDPRPFQAALHQAEATLAKDEAQARNADVEAKRRAHLVDQGFISADEYEQSKTQAEALAAVALADRAAVEQARLQLQYCDIRSPIDGRIGRLLVHAGNIVKDNETILAVINQLQPVYVTFSVPEQQLPAIQARTAAGRSLAVHAFVTGDHSAPAAGELSFVNNTVDMSTGTVLLKGRFANPDERLWPGQFVDVALTLGTRQAAVLASTRAIQTGQEGKYAFVVLADLSVEVRPVTIGEAVGEDTVIEHGLTPGERVVTDGQIRLAHGLKVQIKNDGAAPEMHAEAGSPP